MIFMICWLTWNLAGWTSLVQGGVPKHTPQQKICWRVWLQILLYKLTSEASEESDSAARCSKIKKADVETHLDRCRSASWQSIFLDRICVIYLWPDILPTSNLQSRLLGQSSGRSLRPCVHKRVLISSFALHMWVELGLRRYAWISVDIATMCVRYISLTIYPRKSNS